MPNSRAARSGAAAGEFIWRPAAASMDMPRRYCAAISLYIYISAFGAMRPLASVALYAHSACGFRATYIYRSSSSSSFLFLLSVARWWFDSDTDILRGSYLRRHVRFTIRLDGLAFLAFTSDCQRRYMSPVRFISLYMRGHFLLLFTNAFQTLPSEYDRSADRPQRSRRVFW